MSRLSGKASGGIRLRPLRVRAAQTSAARWETALRRLSLRTGPGEIIRFILPQKSSRLLGDGPRLCGIRIPVEAWFFRILILGKSKKKNRKW